MATSALLGTQSVSTAAPPMPSLSTMSTFAPNAAATSAASYPPGPPPTMTTESLLTRSSFQAIPTLGATGCSARPIRWRREAHAG